MAIQSKDIAVHFSIPEYLVEFPVEYVGFFKQPRRLTLFAEDPEQPCHGAVRGIGIALHFAQGNGGVRQGVHLHGKRSRENPSTLE